MRFRLVALVVLAGALGIVGWAQDSSPAPQEPPQSPSQTVPQTPSQNPPPAAGARMRRTPGTRAWGAMMGGRGVVGIVSEVAADHFVVKNDAGEAYKVNYSVNTKFVKQPAQRVVARGRMRPPPEELKPTGIRVGDAIMAEGEMDLPAKSIGAMLVVKIDPQRAREMREMAANFGKTWLMGRVTEVNETKVTVESPVDNATHTFAADENTSFRMHREPATLADVKPGENVRVEGAVKEGVFIATSVIVMGPPAMGGPAMRDGPPPQ
jgi:hypothetical protein